MSNDNSDKELGQENVITVLDVGYGAAEVGALKGSNGGVPDRIGNERLHRQLKSRHTSMIALGGAIGTGLILTSGVGLARAGPVGILIDFIYIGTLCYGMMVVSVCNRSLESADIVRRPQALGEMAAFLPHQRGFAGHGSRFVSEAWGGMTGITYYLK